MVQLTDPVVKTFIAYSAILALKMIALTLLTVFTRIRKLAFANPEDIVISKSKVKFDDPDVERVRRSHLNDLENIPVFWIVGALYVTTEPAATLATWLFRVYTAGRFLHSFVYAIRPLPQPTRAIAFFIPYFITVYMGIRVVLHYATDL